MKHMVLFVLLVIASQPAGATHERKKINQTAAKRYAKSIGIGQLCKTDADCSSGMECSPNNNLAHKIVQYTCELPCRLATECPMGLACVVTSHGPHPKSTGSRCMPDPFIDR